MEVAEERSGMGGVDEAVELVAAMAPDGLVTAVVAAAVAAPLLTSQGLGGEGIVKR